MFAESVPAGCENIPNFIASFMFKTFCCFGFPRVELYNINSIQFEMILVEYNDMVMRASEVIPDLKSLQGDLVLKSNDESFPDQDITNHLINPNDVSTSLWLLGLRLQKHGAGLSPFQMIFSRRIVERNCLESPDPRQTRRKLQSSVLHCRHCDESFTSKISFRIHQRRHTEEARLRGQREGEAVREKISEEEADANEEVPSVSPSKRILAKRPGHGRNRLQKRKRLAKLAEKWPVDDTDPEDDKKQEVSEHAAEAVRVLLKATREERQRRGKYLSYSPELRDEIAEYAITHGQSSAAQVYSEKLNYVVAESSVRNFVKVFNKFPPQLRLEIGNYAGEHGLEVRENIFYFSVD